MISLPSYSLLLLVICGQRLVRLLDFFFIVPRLLIRGLVGGQKSLC